MVLTGVDRQAATNAVTAAIRPASSQGAALGSVFGGGRGLVHVGPPQSVGTLGIWHFASLLEKLGFGPACLVSVARTEGSVPRERGAWMAVFADALVGTIGGGHVEFQAIAEARRRLAGGDAGPLLRRYALGPSLGQCCGGVMHLQFEPITRADGPACSSAWRPAHARGAVWRRPCGPCAGAGAGAAAWR